MAGFNAWLNGLSLNTAAARHIDDDADGSFDCVDVAEDWAKFCFPGVAVYDLLGYGNAKDLYAGASSQYFDKLPAAIASLPGDIPVWGATATNAFGHIAVTINDDGTNLTDVEQNTYTQEAATIAHRTHNNIIGFLRPKVSIGNDMTITTRDQIFECYRSVLKRDPAPEEEQNVLGRDVFEFLTYLRTSGAGQVVQAEVTNFPDLQAQVTALKAQVADTSEANLLGQALIKLLTAFGYKKG